MNQNILDEKFVNETFEEVGAIITESHVVYTSGRHGKSYVNKDRIYPFTDKISRLCKIFAERYKDYGIDTVIAPATGGIVLSQWTAHHLSLLRGKTVHAVYAEKETIKVPDPEGKDRKYFYETGNFIIGREYDEYIKRKRVLVVEDVLTTGNSIKKVIEVAENIGGRVLVACALCNRGSITANDIGAGDLFSLVNINFETWSEADCPLCKSGIPVNTAVGKGKAFLEKIQNK